MEKQGGARPRTSVPRSRPRSPDIQTSPGARALPGLASEELLWFRPCQRDTEDEEEAVAAAVAAVAAAAAVAAVDAPPEPVDVTGHTWHSPASEEPEPRRETPWLRLRRSEVWRCVLSARSPSPQSPSCL